VDIRIGSETTFAVEYLKTDMRVENVSKLLGHKSIEVTQRHYNPWVTKRQDRLKRNRNAPGP